MVATEKIADAAEIEAAAARLIINTYNEAKQAHNAAQAMFDDNQESIRILKNIQTELANSGRATMIVQTENLLE